MRINKPTIRILQKFSDVTISSPCRVSIRIDDDKIVIEIEPI